MNVGMLWFDNDQRIALEKKVERAVEYYQEKYGQVPTLCIVHPSMLTTIMAIQNKGISATSPPEKYFAAGVEVRTNRSILPNHFWIGVNGVAESNPVML